MVNFPLINLFAFYYLDNPAITGAPPTVNGIVFRSRSSFAATYTPPLQLVNYAGSPQTGVAF